MYTNNILNSQDSKTILNAYTKSQETYRMHLVRHIIANVLYIGREKKRLITSLAIAANKIKRSTKLIEWGKRITRNCARV